MSEYNHEAAVKAARIAVARATATMKGSYQNSTGYVTVEGLLASASPKIEADFRTSATREEVFKARVAELARAFAPIAAADGITAGLVADDANSYRAKAFRALLDSGKSPAGGLSGPVLTAIAKGYTELLPPNLESPVSESRRYGEVTFEL